MGKIFLLIFILLMAPCSSFGFALLSDTAYDDSGNAVPGIAPRTLLRDLGVTGGEGTVTYDSVTGLFESNYGIANVSFRFRFQPVAGFEYLLLADFFNSEDDGYVEAYVSPSPDGFFHVGVNSYMESSHLYKLIAIPTEVTPVEDDDLTEPQLASIVSTIASNTSLVVASNADLAATIKGVSSVLGGMVLAGITALTWKG